MDGPVLFRAATRDSPRNYKSFLARKFLQPDLSEDEEDEDDMANVDGTLLTDEDLIKMFMVCANIRTSLHKSARAVFCLGLRLSICVSRACVPVILTTSVSVTKERERQREAERYCHVTVPIARVLVTGSLALLIWLNACICLSVFTLLQLFGVWLYRPDQS
jgi:hypothetical protein